VAENDGWGSSTKKDKKNKGKTAVEVLPKPKDKELEPTPEPETFVEESVGWGSFAGKKDKKKKGVGKYSHILIMPESYKTMLTPGGS